MTRNSGADFSFLLVAGFILIAGVVCSTLWLQSVRPGSQTQTAASMNTAVASTSGGFWTRFHRGERIKLEATIPVEPETTQAEASDLEAVTTVVNEAGCAACHTIPNVPNAVGQIGPDLSNIGADAATRRDGLTAEEYIRESLVNPEAFTAPDCPTGPCTPGLMIIPPLTDEQINTMVDYLLTLKDN